MLYKNMELHNITNLTNDSEGRLVMSRIPEHVQQKMVTKEIAFQCSGVEVRFKMVDDEITFVIDGIHDDGNLISVMHGSFKSNHKPFFVKGRNEIVITKPKNLERLKLISDEMNLPYDPEMVRVLLSATSYSPPEITGEIESPESLKHPAKTYLAYGSSITSGGSANIQEFNYPTLLARKLEAERLSFGFSGSAKLEREIADYIASLKGVDYITLELGVNLAWDVENNCWGDPVKFRELVEYFVPTIAEAHKDIPIICTDLFLSATDFFRDQTIFDFRDVVREVAVKMERKYRNFKYVAGTDLLTVYDGLNFDVLHPNAFGMVDISDNLYREFLKL